jgi:hypothetical protein
MNLLYSPDRSSLIQYVDRVIVGYMASRWTGRGGGGLLLMFQLGDGLVWKGDYTSRKLIAGDHRIHDLPSTSPYMHLHRNYDARSLHPGSH